jgi:protein SCO1/2
MSARTTRLLLVLAAFLAGLGTIFGIVLLVLRPETAAMAPSAAAIGGSFRLIDQNGRTVTDHDLAGEPYLVFFGFTHCPDVCPTTLMELSDVLDKLGRDSARIGALFITVDPERDTPAELKDYLSSFNPRFKGLTGDPAAITQVAKAYRVYMKKVPLGNGDYTMDHTALVYLMDKNGKFVAPFNLKRPPEDAAADLRRYL